MAEKHFGRQEAEELLPLIQSRLEQACQHKQKVESLDKELARAATRIMMLGGSRPPFAELARKKAERDHSANQLQQAVDKIQETGCVVKDLDMGLVDFPSLREGEEVYLCWKLGEQRIEFWHGIHEGYAGRKPLNTPTPSDEPPQGKGTIQ